MVGLGEQTKYIKRMLKTQVVNCIEELVLCVCMCMCSFRVYFDRVVCLSKSFVFKSYSKQRKTCLTECNCLVFNLLLTLEQVHTLK